VPSNWSIALTGDFNGDGKTDILWRDSSTGTVVIWFMNGVQVASTASLGAVGTDWTIQGTNAD
jgi:FG-GAP repeat